MSSSSITSCWMRCCPAIYKKEKPKRVLFALDILAAFVFTSYDCINCFLIITCVFIHDPCLQWPEYHPPGVLVIVIFMLFGDFVIIYLNIEYGFRLLEPGGIWQGKVIISVIHIGPSVAYIVVQPWHFVLFITFGLKDAPTPPPNADPNHWRTIAVNESQMMYSFSIFLHFFIAVCVACIRISNILGRNYCSAQPPAVIVEDENVPYKQIYVAPVTLRLQLDAESRKFYTGDVIQGHAIVEGVDRTPTITIKFNGKSEVWSKRSNLIMHTEKFLEEKVEGQTSFHFTLPSSLPPSFSCEEEEERGFISYEIILFAVVGLGGLPLALRMPISVYQKPTVHLPFEEKPCEIELEKFLPGWMCLFNYKNGPYGFLLALPKTSFMIGEEIAFKADMYNKSRKSFNKISAMLYSKVVLRTPRSTEDGIKVWDKVILSQPGLNLMEGSASGGIAMFFGVLKIPKSAPESATLSVFPKNLEIGDYVFRFIVEIQGMFEDIEVDIPVTVGSPLSTGSTPRIH